MCVEQDCAVNKVIRTFAVFKCDISNYDRASDACVCPCVYKSALRTADVTVTKIAGYVRVRILMNR